MRTHMQMRHIHKRNVGITQIIWKMLNIMQRRLCQPPRMLCQLLKIAVVMIHIVLPMMQLGAQGVFVGSGIFKSGNPAQRAAAIVKATTFHDDPAVVAEVSRGLGEAMVGLNVDEVPVPHRLSERGW